MIAELVSPKGGGGSPTPAARLSYRLINVFRKFGVTL